MNETGSGPSSDVKITTSPKEVDQIINRISAFVKVLSEHRRGKHISDEEKQAVADFIGKDDKVYKRALSLYWQAISLVANNRNDNESATNNLDGSVQEFDDIQLASKYITQMSEAIIYIAAKIDESVLRPHFDECEEVFTEIGIKAKEIFLSNNIVNLPPEKMNFINILMSAWSITEESMDDLENYKTFRDKMQRSGRPLDESVDLRYFYSYTFYCNNKCNNSDDKIIDILKMNQDYWFGRVEERLKSKDIDAIWKDDIVNLFLQEMDIGLFRSNPNIPTDESQINALREEILSLDCFSEENIEKALHTMDVIIEKNRDVPIEDEEDIDLYTYAYRIVSLKELLSRNQPNAAYYSQVYSKFIIMQSQSFDTKNPLKIKDRKAVLKNATRDYCLKEARKQLIEGNCNPAYNKVTCWLDPDADYKGIRGKAGIVESFSTISLNEFFINPLAYSIRKNLGKINTLTHEVNHCVLRTYIYGDTNVGFDLYMMSKTDMAERYRDYVFNENYGDLYYELRAEIAGKYAEYNTLKEFPVGYYDDGVKKTETTALKDSIFNRFISCLYNKLKDGNGKDFIYSIKIFDEVVREKRDELLGEDSSESKRINNRLLRIEYREDGTPKTLQEIIQDQEKEMETGIFVPDVGPQSTIERLKFRIRMMMTRAVAYDKEEEFVNLTNDFLQRHYDELSQYDIIREMFPNKVLPSYEESLSLSGEYFENYKLENAELISDVGKVVTRAEVLKIFSKSKFGREVIEASRKEAMHEEKQPPKGATAAKTITEEEGPLQ